MARSFSTQIPTDHRLLSEARLEVGKWVHAQLADSLRAGNLPVDIELVLTELAANVVDHTDAPWMRLGVELHDDAAVVTVENPAPAVEVPPVEVWGTLEHGDRGRGLRIVQALCASIVVTGDDTITHIRCELPLA